MDAAARLEQMMAAHRRRNAAWYARHRAAILERRRTAYKASCDAAPLLRRQRGRAKSSTRMPHKTHAMLVDELAAFTPAVCNGEKPAAGATL